MSIRPLMDAWADVPSEYLNPLPAQSSRDVLYVELDKEFAKLHAEIASLRGSIAALHGILYATRTVHLVKGAVRRASYNGRKRRA